MDIVIEEEWIGQLPEDGIPDEISAIIHHERMEGVVEKEQEGYVISPEEIHNDTRSMSDGKLFRSDGSWC